MWVVYVLERKEGRGRWVEYGSNVPEPSYDDLNALRMRTGGAKAVQLREDGTISQEIVQLKWHAYRVRYTDAQAV